MVTHDHTNKSCSVKSGLNAFTKHIDKDQLAQSVQADHGPYSPTILKKISLFFSPKIGKLECNTTSDWLNHMVYPIRSCVTFKCFYIQKKSGEQNKEHSKDWSVNMDPGQNILQVISFLHLKRHVNA